ncbi:MAG: hypothetical protein HC905_09635 [Bacteroidales bacterium]|nr:hypothetical protein [Bacteroidales bacterium]
MENLIQIEALFEILESKDNKLRYEAFQKLLFLTEKKVTWIYDFWQMLVEKLRSDNSYQRSIGFLLLANLSASDSENKFPEILDDYIGLLNDEKFITSRQCIQKVWKVALNCEQCRGEIVEALKNTYYNNIHLATHGNLIKEDVISSLNFISKHGSIEAFTWVNTLIVSETDVKLVKN